MTKLVAYRYLPDHTFQSNFYIVRTIAILFNCLPNILHFTLIAGQKVNQISSLESSLIYYKA